MASKRVWLKMLVMVPVFGVMVAGCDDGGDDPMFGDITIAITGLNSNIAPQGTDFLSISLASPSGEGRGTIANDIFWPLTSGSSVTVTGREYRVGQYQVVLTFWRMGTFGGTPEETLPEEALRVVRTADIYSVPGIHSIPFSAFN